MKTETQTQYDRTYRGYFTQTARVVADDMQAYEAWMRTNKLAFRVLNPDVPAEQFDHSFFMFMFETYEGQLPGA